jgi:ribose transport system ATP-binding protein
VFAGEHDSTDATVLRGKGLRRRTVLDGVDLTVHPGEVVGLGGLLGSGRTETMKALAGLQPLDSGEIEVAGKRVRTGSAPAAIRAGLVLVPEDRKAEGIIPNLSVRENIVLAALPRLSVAGVVSKRKQREIVDTFMRRLRIKAASPEQKVGELSGGNQQKVMLARWLITTPKVLILDEPTRGIDVGAKAEIQKLVASLAADGLAVLYISAELEEVLRVSHTVGVLRDRTLVARLDNGPDLTEDDVLRTIASGVHQ